MSQPLSTPSIMQECQERGGGSTYAEHMLHIYEVVTVAGLPNYLGACCQLLVAVLCVRKNCRKPPRPWLNLPSSLAPRQPTCVSQDLH